MPGTGSKRSQESLLRAVTGGFLHRHELNLSAMRCSAIPIFCIAALFQSSLPRLTLSFKALVWARIAA